VSGLDLLYTFDKSIFIYFRLNEKLFPTDGQFTILEDKSIFFFVYFRSPDVVPNKLHMWIFNYFSSFSHDPSLTSDLQKVASSITLHSLHVSVETS
jgi:hypothetical protein